MQKILIFNFLICFSLNATEIIKLQAPDLSTNKIMRYSTGIRPCRTSGIRLEAEKIQNKLIIHDYGHGGSGISLSWGCAQEAVQIMQRATNNQGPIAVIGAGVIGLTTAHILKDQGYDVTLYSRDFVPDTTSNKAAGKWSSHFGSSMPDKSLALRIKDFSRSKFYTLAMQPSPEFQGISQLPVYEEKVQYKPTDELVILHINDIARVFKKTLKFIFDLNLYMQDLFEKARDKGILFEHKTIQSIDELVALPEETIFNCTGLGSRELFNDTALYPVKGHIVIFEAQPEINYAICNLHQKQNHFFSVIPWKSQLVLGGTLEKGIEDLSVDQDKINSLLEQAHDFFNPH